MDWSAHEFQTQRKKAVRKLQMTWDDIARRHAAPVQTRYQFGPGQTRALALEDDDVIDLDSMTIVQDRGIIANWDYEDIHEASEDSDAEDELQIADEPQTSSLTMLEHMRFLQGVNRPKSVERGIRIEGSSSSQSNRLNIEAAPRSRLAVKTPPKIYVEPRISFNKRETPLQQAKQPARQKGRGDGNSPVLERQKQSPQRAVSPLQEVLHRKSSNLTMARSSRTDSESEVSDSEPSDQEAEQQQFNNRPLQRAHHTDTHLPSPAPSSVPSYADDVFSDASMSNRTEETSEDSGYMTLRSKKTGRQSFTWLRISSSDTEVEAPPKKSIISPPNSSATVLPASGEKRGPGRPRKIIPAMASTVDPTSTPSGEKRRPGRPRKTLHPSNTTVVTPRSAGNRRRGTLSLTSSPSHTKALIFNSEPRRGPGRPRKNPLPVESCPTLSHKDLSPTKRGKSRSTKAEHNESSSECNQHIDHTSELPQDLSISRHPQSTSDDRHLASSPNRAEVKKTPRKKPLHRKSLLSRANSPLHTIKRTISLPVTWDLDSDFEDELALPPLTDRVERYMPLSKRTQYHLNADMVLS